MASLDYSLAIPEIKPDSVFRIEKTGSWMGDCLYTVFIGAGDAKVLGRWDWFNRKGDAELAILLIRKDHDPLKVLNSDLQPSCYARLKKDRQALQIQSWEKTYGTLQEST